MSSRIISLAPGATEIILALKQEDALVGRSHQCDMTPKVRSLPALTEPDASAQGFKIKLDMLQGLLPTLIVTPVDLPALTLEPAPVVVKYAPRSFLDITSTIAALGDRIRDATDPATKVVGKFTGKAATVSMKTLTIPQHPTVISVEHVDPLIVGGLWVPEMIETAGGTALLAQKGEPSRRITFDELRAADPDILLFHLRPSERSAPSIATLLTKPEWASLRAVKEGKAAIAKPHLFNRPGPRLSDGVEVLGEVLHPGKFTYGHMGKLWSWV